MLPIFWRQKLEAFKSRGNKDGRTSHDFEDIIYILENRQDIWQEILSSAIDIKEYLLSEFRHLLKIPHILEWIDSNVERGSQPATYDIYQRLKELVNNQGRLTSIFYFIFTSF